jgi:DNA-binding transcriptional MerR regulator
MNNIKNTFTILDLETLTGIKAHTIRIWEKRYNLLNPTRLNRNIRVYSLPDLQRILNISVLYNHNHKISKLAKLTDSQLAEKAKEIELEEFSNNYEINSLIISMYTFDENLFQEIYSQQMATMSFENIYVQTYLPLLRHMGVLWQTDAIKPVNEHFISNLIFQKIVLNTAAIEAGTNSNDPMQILFLPHGEIHELGLLFLNYALKLRGERTVYLGKSIPFDNLFYVNSQFKEITWICNFMIDMSTEKKDEFIQKAEELLKHTKNKIIIIGNIWDDYSKRNKNTQIIFKNGFETFIAEKNKLQAL